MPEFDIIPVSQADRKGIARFIKVPWFIHREHAPSDHWVPPLLMDRRDYLNPRKNPMWRHMEGRLWIARQNGRDVGRVAAVIDRAHNDHHGEKTGFIGMFESPNDRAVAQGLFDVAIDWLRGRGMTKAMGPTELNSNYMWGCLLDAYDRDPGINMPYNPPYYPALFEMAGFSKSKDLFQWAFDVRSDVPERIARVADRVKKREKLTLRQLDHDDWDAEVDRCLEIYNDAWEANWGFVPLDRDEWHHIAKDLKMVLNPKLGLMAEVDGVPVAFALSIMNVNPTLKKVDGRLNLRGLYHLLWDIKVTNSIDSGRLVLLGIRRKYRRRGIDVMLMVETHRAGQSLGYVSGELGWTLEDNEMINSPIRMFGAQKCATYRVYERGI